MASDPREDEEAWWRRPDSSAVRSSMIERFRADLGLGPAPIRMSWYNLSRLFRSTGERPERLDRLRELLAATRLEWDERRGGYQLSGPWDHVDLWARGRRPAVLVSHPYGLSDLVRRADHLMNFERIALEFPSVRIEIDDRPSYYGWGTHHVRLEIVDPRKPYKPVPSSTATRRVVAAFDREMREGPSADPFARNWR